MLRRERRNAVVDLVPHFVGSHWTKFTAGNFDGQVELAAMTDLHDHRIGPVRAGQKLGHQLDWFLRGGKADARQELACQAVETLKRERQMSATLIVGDRVNFVDDDGLYRCENLAAF